MSETRISMRLIGDSRAYQPAETLAGEFFVDIDEPHDIRAVEVSVLWFTEGKGDEDMAVHFFDRISNDNGHFVDMRQSQKFETTLPHSPLSYDGVIVKIRWCVRIRVFLSRGRDIASEQSFRLGTVPRGLPAEEIQEQLEEDKVSDNKVDAEKVDTVKATELQKAGDESAGHRTDSDKTDSDSVDGNRVPGDKLPEGQAANSRITEDKAVKDKAAADKIADDKHAESPLTENKDANTSLAGQEQDPATPEDSSRSSTESGDEHFA